GRRLAEGLVEPLRAERPVALYASTSRRAIETAAPIARALGLPLALEPALCEVDFGRLEGLGFDAIERDFPEAWRAWMERPAEVRFPGGESLADVAARTERASARIAARHPGAAVVVVSHGGPIRAAVTLSRGRVLAAAFELEVAHRSIQAVRATADGLVRERG
ncbi:MAG TPA: histidine phosphatase family protein, partial [Anaeromyxobacteraceae bacterium]|nr:histidine phosphatase family protein [Anaeromyxobacteraceae bacterium]